MATTTDETIMVINISSSTDGRDGDEQVSSSLLATSSSAAIGLTKKKRRRWTCFDELRCYSPNSRKQLGPYRRSRLYSIIIALQYILPVVAFTLIARIAMNHSNILLFEKEQVGGANEEEAIAMKMKRIEEDKKERDRYDIKQRQIASYINNTGIILNVHITHHAGTSICNQMRQLGNTPDFACMERGRNDDTYWPQDAINKNQLFKKGQRNVGSRISYNETGDWVSFWQQYFHYVSMEFGELHAFGSWGDYLHQTNWEYEGLVSMIVMRDPLERFLSRGKCGDFHGTLASGDPTNETQALYWEYANSDCADNYALRVLTENSECVNGADTSTSCLDSAKELLKRFTFILDQSCLAESMVALGKKLQLNVSASGFEGTHRRHNDKSIRDRFGNDTLYDYVRTRFQRDIELYEWSKRRSIVVCTYSGT